MKWNQVLTISGSNASMNQRPRRWRRGEVCLTWLIASGIIIVVSALGIGLQHAFQEEEGDTAENVFTGNEVRL